MDNANIKQIAANTLRIRLKIHNLHMPLSFVENKNDIKQNVAHTLHVRLINLLLNSAGEK